jgi:molybdate transport system substrate-binding protein
MAASAIAVAVAANFTAPLAHIAGQFSAATGHTVAVAAGATGKFHAQVAAGAPFDVLLAADQATPGRLVASGYAVAGSQFTYAVGRLVLWSAQPGVVDGDGAVLARRRDMRIAIADPKSAPYGAAAMDVLKARGLVEATAPRLVTAQSIGQAFQFVATGNAEIGFVALSQVAAPGRPAGGSRWLVPATLHRPIRQDAVLLKAGETNPAARALMDYLKTQAARDVIASFGYGV